MTDDATATTMRARERRDRPFETLPKAVQMDYLFDARNAIEACDQWNDLRKSDE